MHSLVFLVALIPPLLYAATNHIDNILLQKYFKEGGVGTLLLFSALLSVLALPVLYLIDPSILDVGTTDMLLLGLVGAIDVLLLWSYLQALFGDEPTVVIIYYQLVPVIALGLGYVLLGETISSVQTLAMITIILGALILTVALDNDGRIVFRTRTAIFMLIASTAWALESVLFKIVALEENLYRSLFWEHVALVVIGFIIFSLLPSYRSNFLIALRSNSNKVLGLNIANEILFMLGNSAAAFVVLLIPVTLTLLMNSFQPLFVLVIGYMLMWFVPSLNVESVRKDRKWQKLLAIILTGVGVYLLGEW